MARSTHDPADPHTRTGPVPVLAPGTGLSGHHTEQRPVNRSGGIGRPKEPRDRDRSTSKPFPRRTVVAIPDDPDETDGSPELDTDRTGQAAGTAAAPAPEPRADTAGLARELANAGFALTRGPRTTVRLPHQGKTDLAVLVRAGLTSDAVRDCASMNAASDAAANESEVGDPPAASVLNLLRLVVAGCDPADLTAVQDNGVPLPNADRGALATPDGTAMLAAACRLPDWSEAVRLRNAPYRPIVMAAWVLVEHGAEPADLTEWVRVGVLTGPTRDPDDDGGTGLLRQWLAASARVQDPLLWAAAGYGPADALSLTSLPVGTAGRPSLEQLQVMATLRS